MKKLAFDVLRVFMAVTFIWIGFMIFQDPVSWGGFVAPWVVSYLPVPLNEFMIGTAILDVILGFMMMINFWMPVASIVASLHLIGILVASGIDAVTVRDIGLLGATLALALESLSRYR